MTEPVVPGDLRELLEKALPAVRVCIAACGLGHVEGKVEYWEALEAKIEAELAGPALPAPEPRWTESMIREEAGRIAQGMMRYEQAKGWVLNPSESPAGIALRIVDLCLGAAFPAAHPEPLHYASGDKWRSGGPYPCGRAESYGAAHCTSVLDLVECCDCLRALGLPPDPK